MGKPSRDKGARAERELVKMLPGARKVSYAWKSGPDIEWLGRQVEVKRRKVPVSRTMDNYVKDVDMLMTRADNGWWMVYMELATLLDLLDEARLREV